MKNREKLREQILEWAVAPGKDICDFKRKEVLAHFGKEGCEGISCSWCAILLELWLDEEYKEPEVDWDNVPVDTLVRVRNSVTDNWRLMYFKEFCKDYHYNKYITWIDGKTSKTAEGAYLGWQHCELVEEEEDGE